MIKSFVKSCELADRFSQTNFLSWKYMGKPAGTVSFGHNLEGPIKCSDVGTLQATKTHFNIGMY